MENEPQDNALEQDHVAAGGTSSADRNKIIPEWRITADDQIVLVAFAVLAILLLAWGWNSWRSGDDVTGVITATIDGNDNGNGGSGNGGGNDIDLAPIAARFDIGARASGAVAVLTGTVASQADIDAAGAAAASVAGIERVDNRLRIADAEEAAAPTTTTEAATSTSAAETTTTTVAAVGAANAIVQAGDNSIALTGTVPTEAAATELRASAAETYSEDQITDAVEVVEGSDPFNLLLAGVLGSQASVDAVSTAFGGITGATVDNQLSVDANAVVAAQLNELYELEPVLFESGTDVIVQDSLPTLDKAAEILNANPEAKIGVGGHTDSRGDDAANLTLSQSRADAVVAALAERGVRNDLEPVGYGETQLLENPDDTAEQQQRNRRIEFSAR